MIDLNKWYKDFTENPGAVKADMVRVAYDIIIDEFKHESNLDHCEMDLNNINYSHYCDRLGWPDLQDGGIFEDAIEIAGEMAILAYFGYLPTWRHKTIKERKDGE